MCWEDLVIGRKIKSQVWTGPFTGVIPANGKRIGIWLSIQAGSAAQINITPNGITTTLMFVVNRLTNTSEFSNSPSQHVSIWEIGDAIYNALSVVVTAGGIATVIETWIDDPPDVAAKEALIR